MMSSTNASNITPLKRKIKDDDGVVASEDLRFVKYSGTSTSTASTVSASAGEVTISPSRSNKRSRSSGDDEGPASAAVVVGAAAAAVVNVDNDASSTASKKQGDNIIRTMGGNSISLPLLQQQQQSHAILGGTIHMEPGLGMIPPPPPPPPRMAEFAALERDNNALSGQFAAAAAPPPEAEQEIIQQPSASAASSSYPRRRSSFLAQPYAYGDLDDTNTTGQQQHIHSDPFAMDPMLDVEYTDAVFRKAALITVCSWMVLVCGTYTVYYKWDFNHVPTDEEEDVERLVPKTAFFVLLVSLINQLLPWLKRVAKNRTSNATSGVAITASTILAVSCLTNALLAWGPSAVVLDPVTGSKVFLLRWCEWIPLSFLMTLLAESTDVAARPCGWNKPFTNALCQCLSSFCGILFPYCQTKIQWVVLMITSCILFSQIFPRVETRKRLLQNTPKGKTVLEREYYDRRRFAWYLMGMCSVIWSTLVVFYFINMVIHLAMPMDHWSRHRSLAMSLDTSFDVLSKVIFNRIIFHAHQAIFDSDLKNSRQLKELKELMSLLWVSSSDVIVVSKQQTPDRTVSMLSPSFLQMVGANPPLKTSMNPQDNEETQQILSADSNGDDESTRNGRKSPALVVVTDQGQLTSAHYVDSWNASIAEDAPQPILAHEELQHNTVTQALRIVNTAWSTCCSGHPSEDLQSLSIKHCDPNRTGKVMCELKALRYSEQTAMAVVRDVTERHRRFEAESRAHAETIARQKDMHAANRFTRHEVKNGLLAGIELCDTLGQSLNELKAKVAEVGHVSGATLLARSTTSIVDLDDTLRGVLDTVMAEVMAREVVHEVYQPRLEELDVPSMLVAKLGLSKDRIPVNIRGGSIPKLLLDAQLIGHIHRNAVSNACKYGKHGGNVQTYVEFDEKTKEFRMEVTNEPGLGHEDLLALGESASEFVFAQGVRLQPHMKNKKEQKLDSSGDGAWIMQKCAKTMNGTCDIRFYKDITRFTMSCPAVPMLKGSQP